MSKLEKIVYECTEFDCKYCIEVDSEEELVRIVQKHTADEHDSFELEDIIIANSKRVFHEQ